MRNKIFLPLVILMTGTQCRAQEFDNSVIGSSSFLCSSFISDGEGWLADNNGSLWHTADSAATWDSVSVLKNFTALQFTDALSGFALTADSAYETEDGGNTWLNVSLPAAHHHSLFLIDKNTGLVSGHEEIYRTADGGTTWSTVETPGVTMADYYFTDPFTGIAAAFDDSLYRCIWRTTDGGLTWNNVHMEENCFINSVWFTSESKGWAAGYYTKTGRGHWPLILGTTDGGITWKGVYLNQHPGDIKGEKLTDIRFRNDLEGFALSGFTESVITLDGGLTWQLTYDAGTPLLPYYGVFRNLDGHDDLYLVGEKGNVAVWK